MRTRRSGLLRVILATAALVWAVACSGGVRAVPTATPAPTPRSTSPSRVLELLILCSSDSQGATDSLARRATFIKTVRASAQNARLLVLDGGNSLWGSRRSRSTTLSQGLVMVEGMSLMGYDVMALGPTDLQLGMEILWQLRSSARFAIVSANVVRPAAHDEWEDPPFVEPYAVVRAGDVPVGILGLTRTEGVAPFGMLKVEDPAYCLPRYLKQLTSQTDIVIALSSLGWDDNLRLAEVATGIGLIIGSSDTSAANRSWRSERTGTVVWQPGTQAGEDPGAPVHVIKLTVGDGGRVIGYSESLPELGTDIADDAEMLALLDSFESR